MPDISEDITQRGRETKRKRMLREVLSTAYEGQVVLLDELRWRIFESQRGDSDPTGTAITRSWLNSFARTVREQLPSGYRIEKVPIGQGTPVGLVARAAVYRLKDVSALRAFLQAKSACILCRWKTNLEVAEPRYRQRYVTPHHHVATFRFFQKRPSKVTYGSLEATPGTLIPTTQKLTLIVPRGMQINSQSGVTVPWKLFRYDELSEWHEVAAGDPLSDVQRDRQG